MRHALLPLALVAGSLIVYHLLVSQNRASESEELAELRTRVAALEAQSDTSHEPRLAGAALDRRLASLEARLDTLAARKRPEPVAMTAEAPAPDEPGYVWDDRALAWLEAALVEVRRRDLAERQEVQYRSMLERIAPEESEERREEALVLLLAYHDQVRAIYPGGSAGATQAEREDAARLMAACRSDLVRQLRALLPDAAADAVIRTIPGDAGAADSGRDRTTPR